MAQQPDWDVWRGVEVEGRLVGVPTTLIRRFPSGFDAGKDVLDPHVFFINTHWKTIDGRGEALNQVDRALTAGKLVTLEVDVLDLPLIPYRYRVMCHLMVSFDSPEIFGWLKPSDTIRLLDAPFTTACVTFGQMTRTTPPMYDQDERLA